jgi:alpha-ketoglutarate-dependent taurine dioxygenase
MLNRMFEVQVDEVPADFGRELTPATVGAVIEQERQEERRYVETQASSITLLREWLAR